MNIAVLLILFLVALSALDNRNYPVFALAVFLEGLWLLRLFVEYFL